MFKLVVKPLNKGLWRVNGIARLYVTSKNYLRAEIAFSELDEQGLDARFSRKRETGKVVVRSFSISHLFHLKLGGLWLDGKSVNSSKPLPTLHFNFDSSKQKLIELGEIASVKNRLLNNHSHYKGMAKTYAVLLPLFKEQYGYLDLIIPCSEVVRFYFGVSQRMIRYVAKGRTRQLINWDASYVKGDVPQLTMLKNTTCLESCVLAEAVVRPTFRQAMNYVFKSLQSQVMSNESELRLKAEVPIDFFGAWDVAGVGVEVDGSRKGFFVTELMRCERLIGFTEYERHRDVLLKLDVVPNPDNRDDGGEQGRPSSVSHVPKKPDEEPPNQSSEETDKKLKPVMESVYSVSYDSYYRVIKKNVDTIVSIDGDPIVTKPIEVLANSYEDFGKGANGVQQVQGAVQHLELTEGALTKFVDMTRELEVILNGAQLSSIEVFSSVFAYLDVYVSQYPDEVAGCRTWHKVKQPDGKYRPSCFVVVEFSRNGLPPFYLVELERAPEIKRKLCYLYVEACDGSRCTSKDFEELLLLTALNNNWPLNHKAELTKQDFVKRRKRLLNRLRMKKLTHPSGVEDIDLEKWAEQVMGHIAS